MFVFLALIIAEMIMKMRKTLTKLTLRMMYPIWLRLKNKDDLLFLNNLHLFMIKYFQFSTVYKLNKSGEKLKTSLFLFRLDVLTNDPRKEFDFYPPE